ncbi:hypothetical protein AB0A81_27200 [Streptomyces flaveolus]|uniref:Uncharacterized protein n=1 Tax=Streptomyces flaveolus TaxID=67297 RepID=A0ABV1VR92_9ACTN
MVTAAPERGTKGWYDKEKKVDPINVLLIALGFLLPSLVALINSVADRNRAAGKADVIRARRGSDNSRQSQTGWRNF